MKTPKVKRTLKVLLIAFGLSTCVQAQDAIFSQFYNASLYLNPALAGDEENVVLNMSYRSQWNKIHFPYTTGQASLIVPHYRNHHRTPSGHLGGFGVSMFKDVSGENANFNTTGGNIAYAYNLQLDRKASSKISFAIQAGFVQKKVDTDDLYFGSQYVRYYGFVKEQPEEFNNVGSRTYIDITAGAFYRYNALKKGSLISSAYSGISVAHLNNPNENPVEGQVSRLPLLYKYHGGLIFGISRSLSVSANVLSMIQDRENQTNFGSYLSYAIPTFAGGKYNDFLFRIGGWYRLKDACIANMEFVLDRFKVGFSYDWNVSSLRYSNRGVGTYEISLGINLTRFAPPKVQY